jgi:hypothetical protein
MPMPTSRTTIANPSRICRLRRWVSLLLSAAKNSTVAN